MQTLHREQEIDQTANLRAEAGYERLLHNAGVDAEPIPELEFDQTLGWLHRTIEVIVRAARRARVRGSFSQIAAGTWVCGVPVEWWR